MLSSNHKRKHLEIAKCCWNINWNQVFLSHDGFGVRKKKDGGLYRIHSALHNNGGSVMSLGSKDLQNDDVQIQTQAHDVAISVPWS